MTDIGRAGIVMKGNYNSASTYETLDAVSYSLGLYIAKQNVPVNTPPTDTTYWQQAITPGTEYPVSVIGTQTNAQIEAFFQSANNQTVSMGYSNSGNEAGFLITKTSNGEYANGLLFHPSEGVCALLRDGEGNWSFRQLL